MQFDHRSRRRLAVWLVSSLLVPCVASAAALSESQQRCVVKANAAFRQVAYAKRAMVRRCLANADAEVRAGRTVD